jgi:hypothetical protein
VSLLYISGNDRRQECEGGAPGQVWAYVRVSTAKQDSSGLGREAQQAAIANFVQDGDQLLKTYVEVESGKNDARPELAKTLRHVELTGAKLLVAKLDRLSRAVSFIARLMDSKVDFIACDQPSATPLTIHIYAAIAEHERKIVPAPKGCPEPSKRPSNVLVLSWFSPDQPGRLPAILIENMLKNQSLTGRSPTLPERPLVRRDDPHLHPINLILCVFSYD